MKIVNKANKHWAEVPVTRIEDFLQSWKISWRSESPNNCFLW